MLNWFTRASVSLRQNTAYLPMGFDNAGAMVARYTRALSSELALDEFARVWLRN